MSGKNTTLLLYIVLQVLLPLRPSCSKCFGWVKMATERLFGRSVNVLKLEGCIKKSLTWHPLKFCPCLQILSRFKMRHTKVAPWKLWFIQAGTVVKKCKRQVKVLVTGNDRKRRIVEREITSWSSREFCSPANPVIWEHMPHSSENVMELWFCHNPRVILCDLRLDSSEKQRTEDGDLSM
jgi:hypothetical protein